jgi:hypothetical protein
MSLRPTDPNTPGQPIDVSSYSPTQTLAAAQEDCVAQSERIALGQAPVPAGTSNADLANLATNVAPRMPGRF